MSKKKAGAEKAIRDIRRATRRQYFAEEKIRVVLEGLRAESSISELCCKERIADAIGCPPVGARWSCLKV